MSERVLQQNIRDAINTTELFHASIVDVNLIPYTDPKTGKKKFITNQATPGVADIYVQGPEQKGFWIEVKKGSRWLTEMQEAWMRRIHEKSGLVCVVNSVDMALNLCRRECKRHGWTDERLEAMLK